MNRMFAIGCLAALIGAASLRAETTPIQQAEVRGSGPATLVLIPGVNSDWTMWLGFMERNESRYTMHAVTLPGFGGTAPPPETTEDGEPVSLLDNGVAAVEQYLVENDLDDVYLIGHGFGGQIAMLAAGEAPDRVAGVVTVDGYPAIFLGQILTQDQRDQLVAERIRPQLEQMVTTQWRNSVRTVLDAANAAPEVRERLDLMLRRTPRGVGIRYAIAYFGADITEELSQVQTPILALASLPEDRHPMLTPGFMQNMWNQQLSKVPASLDFGMFEDTSHFLMIQRPQAFDDAIEAFVAGRDVPALISFPAGQDAAQNQAPGGEQPAEPGGESPEQPPGGGGEEQPNEPG